MDGDPRVTDPRPDGRPLGAAATSSTPGVPPLPPTAFPDAPTWSAAPVPPAVSGPVPGGRTPREPRALSVLSLVTGVLGIVTVLFTLGVTVVLSVVGIVTGHLASGREPRSRTLWLTGLVTGYVGLLAAVCLWAGLAAFFVAVTR